MKGLDLLYRGSLKSCNYQCSYCPFSKHRRSERELQKDQNQWMHLVRTMEERADMVRTLMVVPYGEALIHSWYWEGLARITALPALKAAGSQTNGSFPVKESLRQFCQAGGEVNKLRLWVTFHPEMIQAEAFADTCNLLLAEGVRFCVGAVAVPNNLKLLKKLREKLPEDLYLWMNRMDGLRRSYTPEETEEFCSIDPYFGRELADVPADLTQCAGRLFVEGDGRTKTCNISRYGADFRERLSGEPGFLEPLCGCRRCSCYLAYGGRRDFINQVIFGPWPVFRIPRRPKAVFLDIVGTLISREGKEPSVSGWVRAGLEGLRRDHVPLFFATTLPYREAKRRCRPVWHLFSGGVFAGGGHLVVEEAGKIWERYEPVDEKARSLALKIREWFGGRMLVYRTGEKIYKITIVRNRTTKWEQAEMEAAEKFMMEGVSGIRIFGEENCLQIVSDQATKEAGVCRICRRIGVKPKEAASAGDSKEDLGMLALTKEPSKRMIKETGVQNEERGMDHTGGQGRGGRDGLPADAGSV